VLTKPPHVLTKPSARGDEADARPAHAIRAADLAAVIQRKVRQTPLAAQIARPFTHVLNRGGSGVHSPLDR
jgi:hypothetical protein